ncbi:GNAT family N-acetyltransferase [Streptomyces benahoarensis]|uniref:GNAT family N-acetyltransferase n=1 Tax=Streptomyces benahoarensis TaxID=2595054 RepID=A0A553Z5L9_9ACTN|nr:GNAT family N-acetyltransferase [Streptomyces benahoarensis]TSB23842.1 GNAT family N-acetyltransferase [Streptomyces benahoarensis]TSB36760.1 GNAT family N-acetyltransferase [Streptomyces benahoarensis]
MKPVTLTTERLLLRPFRRSDAPAVHTACQDPDIPRWTSVPYPYTLRDAEHFTGAFSPQGWRQDTDLSFAVLTRDTDALVGAVGLVRLDRLHTPEHQAELGYWTAREQRGKGYTAEAAAAVVRWAFRDLGVERLEWRAEAGNHGSWAVARRTGFHREGTLRGELVRGGTRRDVWLGSLLPSDLPAPDAPPREPAARTPYLPYGG